MDANHRNQPEYWRYGLAGSERWDSGVGEESSSAQRCDASPDRKRWTSAARHGDEDTAICRLRLRDGTRVPRLRQEDRRNHLGDADTARSADRRTDDVYVQREAICRG